ncbi:rod shape-determining protein MreD [Metabacillus herbersteinensis]|uniref:Rod shape-determining protein MreD n=1 Tax=Metabacillus herbersteinensis TaxID=283816 RepID=A0ABV6G903_9BACI
MRRLFLPLIMLVIFISESIFVDLVHVPFSNNDQLFIPHFLMLAITFVTAYVNQSYGMIYGIVFGLLFDIIYTEVIGVYLFSFGLFAYLMSKALKILHGNVLIVLFLGLLSISVLEFYVYGIHLLIGTTTMSLYNFTTLRLLPTLALNLSAGILLIYPLKGFLTKLKIEQFDE